jgi:hypothetical protein
MTNTNRVCPSCHMFGSGCQGRILADGETCPRYEHRLQWLSRQIDVVRHAESRARAVAAAGALTLLLSFAAWMALGDVGSLNLTAAQQQASASKVLTASASGGRTSTR